MIISGEGKYKVWLKEIIIDDDRVYILGGGEKSHIGGLILCDPGKKSRIIRLENHYDHIVLQPIAEYACKKYNTRIVALGGIHIDNASKDEIGIIVENCRGLIECI